MKDSMHSALIPLLYKSHHSSVSVKQQKGIFFSPCLCAEESAVVFAMFTS